MASFGESLASSIKSVAKLALQSRKCGIGRHAGPDDAIVIMGNGPSLADTIRDHLPRLQAMPLMAVNFAANTDEFLLLKPQYYILADPHFFEAGDANVDKLWRRFGEAVDWEMTLLVPAKYRKSVSVDNPRVKVEVFNPVGVEGFRWLTDAAYRSGAGMPRPRNVLIPAIMTAIRAGYKEIYIVGADHSWMKTLDVDSDNRVVSVQPHFYADNTEERNRVTAVYNNVKLHEIVHSFYVAFKAYHQIQDFARRHDINIYNSTPSSFIDAFPRKPF